MNERGPLSVEQLDAVVDLMGRTGGGAVLPMQGESMVPLLREGQLIAVDLSPFEPEIGDLLLYRQLDYLVVHRCLGPATREDGHPTLRTRGDACLGLDPPLERARVRGRVVAIEERGRWWYLDGGGARAWALAVALHDLFWAGMGVLARRFDLLPARLGIPLRTEPWAAKIDHVTLGLSHRLLFRRLHRSGTACPPGYTIAR
jgi:hypothetical protein